MNHIMDSNEIICPHCKTSNSNYAMCRKCGHTLISKERLGIKPITIVEVSQFFDYESMTWQELIKEEEKGVLPSNDGSVFLWSEKPEIKEVTELEHPHKGDVWLMEGKEGKIEIYKANYDSSD